MTIARPRGLPGEVAPTIPKHVLDIAEKVRSGRMSAAQANRALGGTETRQKPPIRPESARSDQGRRRVALAALEKRLELFRRYS